MVYQTRPSAPTDSFAFNSKAGVEYKVSIVIGDNYDFFYPFDELDCREIILTSSDTHLYEGVDEEVGQTIAHGICTCISKYPEAVFYYTCNDDKSESLSNMFGKWFNDYKSDRMKLITDSFEIDGINLYIGMILIDGRSLAVALESHFRDIRNQLH